MATSSSRLSARDLGRRLARRLLPASIVVAAMVTVGAPLIDYVVDMSTLQRTGDAYARTVATWLQDKSPALWSTEIGRIETLIDAEHIATIRVRDFSGQPLGGFVYVTPRASAWWNRNPPLGTAPVLFNARPVGVVEVGLARDTVLRTTILVVGISAVAGSLVGALIYWFPVTVGRAMETELRALLGQAEELEQVARDITSSLDRVEVLQLVVERARTLCEADLAWLAAYDVESETARILALAGAEKSALTELIARPGSGAAGWVLQQQQALCLPDLDSPVIDADERRAFSSERLTTIAMVPLRIRDVPAGILAVASRTPGRFEDQMSTMTRIASQAGVALENARLYEERTAAAQEGERKRIAYDLHDGIGQLLVSAKQHLDTCRELWDTDRARAAQELTKGVDRLARAVTETRDILTSLRPSSVEAVGLKAAVQDLLVDMGRQQGWVTDFRDHLGQRPVPFAVENAMFRIAQEALANAARHAGARHVAVELRDDDDGWIEAVISDNGRGFAAPPAGAPTTGIGLESMRERARSLGGSLTIASATSGATVRVRLPTRKDGHRERGRA